MCAMQPADAASRRPRHAIEQTEAIFYPSFVAFSGRSPLVAHWVENDAYPYLARSQSEAVRDHIRCEIHTVWGMEFHTHPHDGERAKSADNVVSRGLLLSLLLK